VGVYRCFPTDPHEVIGELAYEGAHYASWSGAEELMKKEAAKVGGNGVVLLDTHSEQVSTWVTPGSVSGSTYGTEQGTMLGNMYTGQYTARSQYQYTPPTSTPIYRKYATAFVIRFLQPQTAADWRNAAITFARQGNIAGAVKALERVVEIEPGRPVDWAALAIVYDATGDRGHAETTLNKLQGMDIKVYDEVVAMINEQRQKRSAAEPLKR
jgi:tetratricopeptide (TPR) repeat protein